MFCTTKSFGSKTVIEGIKRAHEGTAAGQDIRYAVM